VAIMTGFDQRPRFSRIDAEMVLAKPSNMVRHLTDNGDGTFSIVGHIVCAWCDYCDEVGKGPFRAKADIYELVAGGAP
jgi:hypothetical protein